MRAVLGALAAPGCNHATNWSFRSRPMAPIGQPQTMPPVLNRVDPTRQSCPNSLKKSAIASTAGSGTPLEC
jgi:hypothetical protein